jgi:glutathione S-transferase
MENAVRLFYSPTSPYVRKVTVAALETGLDHRIERVPTNVWDPASDFGRFNPLGKVPALLTDDGLLLVESAVIAEYLDSLTHDGPKLFPPDGPERWRVLHMRGIADGALDAAILWLVETRRPEGERSPSWILRQTGKVMRGLDTLDAEVSAWGDVVSIGTIAAGCLLGFLDFRFPDNEWRAARPKLAAWYAAFARRPAWLATQPKEA